MPTLDAFASQTLVIIPAHNEEECVGDVVRRLREIGFQRIRVVENASRDRTAQRAADAGAEVISHPRAGYGLACWVGGEEVPPDVVWLLYCNADASDDLDALHRYAELAPGHDLILGCRTMAEDRHAMSLPQRFGNWLAPFLIRVIWGYRFRDLGPQRAIRVEAYRRLEMQDRGFGWTVEMQVRAAEEGLRIVEIPVRTYPRPAGQQKISGTIRGTLMAGTIILRTIGQLAWRKKRRPIPRRTALARMVSTASDEPALVPHRPHFMTTPHLREGEASQDIISPDALPLQQVAGAKTDSQGFAHVLSQRGLTLRRGGTEILQINTGKLCNLTCVHCHVNAGPKRKEIITRETIDRIVAWLETTDIHTVDLTGGAPEMIPDFRYFIQRLRALPQVETIIDRCNLTILLEPGYEWAAQFIAQHRLKIVASMPCYEPANVNAQRGDGVFDASIRALQVLNRLGYGRSEELPLDLVYNPNGAFLPPDQAELEADYKRELKHHFGIDFHRLFAITNMPIARYKSWLKNNGKLDDYMDLLRTSFNPAAVDRLMCRNTLSIGWQGEVYDCDFNQQLGMQWRNGNPLSVWDIDISALDSRDIALGDHCFGCTAGSGSSCSGATLQSLSGG
ncbi:hypothetical protein DB346_10125 [Verrucomicrobia bacterium LW23]|nr:hypothetical protein DB346_10125 [Verrucomicrobia bacterium LW23]